ncbi:MAG: hypothetical protein LIO70_01140 [Clostridiales bacterium]|nr:hypothetical protein [Clostridiales bacterium]
MKLSTTKTTTTRTTVAYKATLTDGDGKTIATLTGTADSMRPFGNTNMTVTNRTLFEAHKDVVKAQYEAFQAAVAATDTAPVEAVETSEEEIAE